MLKEPAPPFKTVFGQWGSWNKWKQGRLWDESRILGDFIIMWHLHTKKVRYSTCPYLIRKVLFLWKCYVSKYYNNLSDLFQVVAHPIITEVKELDGSFLLLPSSYLKDLFYFPSPWSSTLPIDWVSDFQEASSLSDTYQKCWLLWAGARMSF